jgi:hypothetical protein
MSFVQFVKHEAVAESSPKFEKSEGFLDRFRSEKTMRAKYRKLCNTLSEPLPVNIDHMSKKEILAAIKILKAKYSNKKKGTGGLGGDDIWNMFAGFATAFK